MEGDRGTRGPGAKTCAGSRDGCFGGKGRCCSSRRRRRPVPLSVILLPDTEASGSLATYPQPEAVKQGLHTSKAIPDGNFRKHYPVVEEGHVGSELGSQRRLSAYPNPCGPSEVLGLPLSGPGLQVCIPSLRPVDSPKSVHQSYTGGGFSSAKSGNQRLRLYRRLVDSGCVGERGSVGGDDNDYVAGEVGMAPESREVEFDAESGGGLPRGQAGSAAGFSGTLGEEMGEDGGVFQQFSSQACPSSERLARSSRLYGQSDGGSSTLQTVHETNTGACPEVLQAVRGSDDRNDQYTRGVDSTHIVVDGQKQCLPGQAFSRSSSDDHHHNGCFTIGLGSVVGGQHSVRDLDGVGVRISYQLVGVDGGLAGLSCVEGGSERSSGDSLHRQLDNGSLYKSSGGNPFAISVPISNGSPATLPDTEHRFESVASGGSRKHHGGRPFQGKVLSKRVESIADVGGSPLSVVRTTSCGLVRDLPQQEAGDVCVKELRSGSLGGGRSVVRLGQPLGLRLSSAGTDSASSQQSGIVGNAAHSSGSVLAESTLVSDVDGSTGRLSVPVSSKGGPSDTGQRQDPPQKLTPPTPLCLEVIRCRLREAGLQGEAVELVAKSRRGSTIRTYDSRLGGYYAWARRKHIRPLEASLIQMVDFFVHLFQKGLQVSTIRHYRSAIGAVHTGFDDGSGVSDSVVLRNLFRGMFNSRPPPRRLAPAWSINEVLVALARPPYEPMESASLDLITSKTAFLIAAASGRRRSCIHALTVQEGFLRFTSTGVTLLPNPTFLAKNQTADFTPEPMFLPKLLERSMTAEDKYWCPVRALKWYLKRTSHLRSSDQLFLQVKKPHAPASKATISRWISELIKGIVRSPCGVRTHDVRGQAASKAWFSRVPLEEILKAATWKTASTFVSCYLTDVLSAEGEFSRSVLRVPSS